MKKDEWALTNEMRRLNRFGLVLYAERIKENERYNIRFQQNGKILEPNCGVEEVMGIVNSLELILGMIFHNGDNK